MKYFLTLIFAACLSGALASEVVNTHTSTLDVNCVVSETQTYSRIGKKYYIIGKSKASWFDSLHMCRRFGGDLALIESAQEMDDVSSYLKSKGHDGNDWFWTSGNDLVLTKNFMSVTNGLPLPFTAWSPGQPDVDIEHCVHLWLRNGEFQMNNWLCTEKAFYICQRQNNTRCSVDTPKFVIDPRTSNYLT